MSFYIYDITFLVVFTLLVGWFLYSRRHNLKREGIMYLYRTRLGIKFIDYVGGRYKKTLSVLGFVGVVCGYLLMAGMIYFLYQLIYVYLFVPEVVRAIKIPPLMPLIPYLPEAFKIDFLPPFYFTYWIVAIAVIAIFHEFAHGIMAKRYGVKILTTGFGFLGPFLAAFVEPDEKQMFEKPKYQQIAILSAGVFVNLILAGIFFVMLSYFFLFAYAPAGAMFNTYTPALVDVDSVEMIGGKVVLDSSGQGLLNLIEDNGLVDDLILGSNGNEIKLSGIIVNGEKYYTNIESLKSQIQGGREEIMVFEDLPAINVGLRGVIIEVDGREVEEYEDLESVLGSYEPGDEIEIITKDVSGNGEVLEYDIVLGEDSNERGRAVIGIGFAGGGQRMMGKISEFFNFFKKPATYYKPKFNIDLIIFIYNMIWWLALINFSVALINMWPVAIFDGGRMFMLTMWGISGSERFGKWMFKFTTYLILGAMLLLMLGWFWAVF